MIELVTRNCYWEKLTDWINDYVRSCDECQHNKSPRHAKYGLLQPLEVPYAASTSISTDFITQLPESQGYTQRMVEVDHFTKMAHFIDHFLQRTRPQKTSQTPSFGKYRDFMDSHPKLYRRWMRSFPANFGNLCANH